MWSRDIFVLVLLVVSVAAKDTPAASGDLNYLLNFVSKFIPISEEITNEVCKEESRIYLDGIRTLQPWAMKMLDASSKLQSGLLEGNIKSLGNYDMCVDSQGPIGKTGSEIKGQYCMANIQVTVDPEHHSNALLQRLIDMATIKRGPKEITVNRTYQNMPYLVPSCSLVQWAVCVPTSCSTRDVQLTLDRALSNLVRHTGLRLSAEVFPESCSVKATPLLTCADYCFIAAISLLIITAIAGSAYDLLREPGPVNGAVKKALLAFSVPKNSGRLFNMQRPHDDTFTSLDGIRTLSTLLIILAHESVCFLAGPLTNKVRSIARLSEILTIPLSNNTLAVDVFLLMSGLLKTYHNLKDMSLRKYSVVSSLLRRYIRLTPVHAMMIAFYGTVWTHLGDGPYWHKYVEVHAMPCRPIGVWVFNLLYVNNYINGGFPCIHETWSLSVDMQMFLLSPLIIHQLWHRPRTGLKLLAAAILVSAVVPFVLTYYYSLPPTLMPSISDHKILDFILNFYFVTHTHMSSYLVGIGLGYILYTAGSHTHLNAGQVILGWTCSFALMAVVATVGYRVVQFDYVYDIMEVTWYGGLNRLMWSLSLAWVIFASHYGYGGWLNKFLSARVFIPFSRLSYCLYLTHMALFKTNGGKVRVPFLDDNYFTLRNFLGNTCILVIISTVMYLLVEAPACELGSLCFGRARELKQHSEDSNNIKEKESKDE